MSFPPRPFPVAPTFGFNPQPIFFNPMIGRGFPAQPVQPTTPQKVVPNTTVFVGNITERCTNDFMQKMLEECGKVTSWKRIQGAHGKYQAFGFCDYEDPMGTLRALRILNDFQVGEKKLVVKFQAEDKVRTELRSWAIQKRKDEGKPDLKLKDHEMPADEEDKNKDEEIRLKILNWIEQDHPELLTVAEDGEVSETDKRRKKEDRKDDRKDRHRRSRSTSRNRDRRRKRSKTPKRKRRRSYSSSSESNKSTDTYSSETTHSSRSTLKHKKKPRTPSRESSSDAEERKQLKRALKLKEKAYQDRLARWENREKDKARYYSKMDRRDRDKKHSQKQEHKKLKAFLEDYNDEENDTKFFRHSELFRRRRDFEKEKQQDTKDRLTEIAEIEAIKKEIMEENKMLADEADKAARAKHKARVRAINMGTIVSKEEAALRKLRGDSGSPNPHQQLGQSNGANGYSSSSSAESEDCVSPSSASLSLGLVTTTVAPEKWTTSEEATTPTQGTPNGGIGIKGGTSIKLEGDSAKLTSVFAGEDDEDFDQLRTRKRLKPFEITTEERMENITEIEKKKMIKEIIDKLPTSKAEIFAYPVNYEALDDELISNRVKPWVAKKISELIGSDADANKSVVDFICDKILKRLTPYQILEDVKPILDDDADMFVLKMWRFFIFEAECRIAGLKTKLETQ